MYLQCRNSFKTTNDWKGYFVECRCLSFISMLQNRAVHSHELVEGILKHAIDGAKAYNAELIHVEKFIQDLIVFCNPPSDFEIITEVSIPEIYTDPIILHQIINNLICNSFKYNDKPLGKIKIVVKGDDEQLTFEVIDNGPGIPIEFHERIFEMFQTLSQTDRFGNKGTGIGLNTVKKMNHKKIYLFGFGIGQSSLGRKVNARGPTRRCGLRRGLEMCGHG
jgi:signal transduction histidine kinase